MSNQLSIPLTISSEEILNRIYTIRGVQIMLDFDLAAIYGYETKNLNRQVRNNIEKFPDDMMFRLTKDEADYILRYKNYTSSWGGSRYLPYAFTEQGIYMLMTVLKGDLAVRQSLALVRSFKTMRDYLANNAMVFQRLDWIELKQLETDENFRQIFKKLESPKPDKAIIFFRGQMWDATSCIEEIIGKAEKSIILIDSYVDKATLDMLSRKKTGVAISIHTTQKSCKLTGKEIGAFRSQYGKLEIIYTDEFHDRFLILDNKILYHVGASIKDAGRKAFEISLNEDEKILSALLSRL
ncbi:MAG: ORF6N domain-containing protein [Spirochaetales bacterium]|nr:ORF6N domain-containing protein [Spirochaetales bacterium]